MTGRDWFLLKPLANGADAALLALRLLTGAFLVHGVWDNMVDPARMEEFVLFLRATGFASPEWMAPLSVYAQFLIGIALIFGVATRWAGLLLGFNFIVAVVMVHWDQSFRLWWPAIVLVGLGLLFATLGAGTLALDHLVDRRAGKASPAL
jgi:putative oxidoreductase